MSFIFQHNKEIGFFGTFIFWLKKENPFTVSL